MQMQRSAPMETRRTATYVGNVDSPRNLELEFGSSGSTSPTYVAVLRVYIGAESCICMERSEAMMETRRTATYVNNVDSPRNLELGFGFSE